MTRELDVDRVLADWLAEGPSRLPDHAVQATIDRLDDIPQRRNRLPGGQRLRRLVLSASGVAAALIVAVFAYTLIGDTLDTGGPRYTGVLHASERHGYSIALPDRTWTVEERPGAWLAPSSFFDANSGAGVDYFEDRDAAGGVVFYVYLASQPIPAGSSLEDWMAAHDASNERVVPCFDLQGRLETRQLDGETARVGAFRCDSFDGGDAWTTVQTLVAHDGRGYAIYLWPVARGDAMPPLDDLRAETDRWLDRFSFTD